MQMMSRPSCRLLVEELEQRELLSLMGNNLFPADSPWNTKITNAPVAANSSILVNSIGAGLRFHPDFGTSYEGALNGIPFNVVSGTHPKINVVVDYYDTESDLIPVPIPDGAVIEGDPRPTNDNYGDRHLIIYDKDNNFVYELFKTYKPSETADGLWHARSLAFWDLNKNYFRTPGYTSADAAGLPILPGLVRADEVLDYHVIDHALRFTVSRSASSYVFPASHYAGVNDSTLPRMGERFRLKSTFDISGFSASNQVILRALKEYGMIVADNGGDWFVSGAPSPRWDDDDLHELKALVGNNFEAVDMTPRLVSIDSPASLSTGAVLTLHGSGFAGGAGQTTVMLGSIPAAQVQVVSDTMIRATVGNFPAGATIQVHIASGYGPSGALSINGDLNKAPATPNLVTPIGQVKSAAPTFTWNAVDGAVKYEVWVTDTTSGQSPVIHNAQVVGNSLTPAGSLTVGHNYVWWARAFGANGMASPWSAGAAFTLSPLDTPTLAGPSGLLQSTTVNLSWNAVTGADYYELWIDDVSTGQSEVFRADVHGTSRTVTLHAGHAYAWWVQTRTNSGGASQWSNAGTFNIALLGTPTLQGPSGTIKSASPTFTWSEVPGAIFYDVWVDDTTTGQSGVVRNAQATGSSWTASSPLTPNHNYVFWVRAYVPKGNSGAWTSGMTFSVELLGKVNLIGPGGTIQNATPLITWEAVDGADYYDVWVQDVQTGEVLRNDRLDDTGCSPVNPLIPGHTYQWWVRALAENGNTGPWGNGLVFTVALLDRPTLIGPSGANAGNTFTWNGVNEADSYDLWVDDLTTGQSGVIHGTVEGTSYTASLLAGHRYQWWVQALSDDGNKSLWSTSLIFTV